MHAFDTVGSTNDEAKSLARAGAPHGTLVTARIQESGRGRRGRSWSSPEGNLFLSAVLRPEAPAARAAQLSFAAAVALAECLGAFLPVGITIAAKWPNDVLLEGAKVAGILLEAESGDGQGGWVVLGVGVNCRHHPEDAPYPATSLAAHGAVSPVPGLVLRAFVDRLDHWIVRWTREGFEPVRRAWLGWAVGIGGPVTVRLDRETLEGRFADLDTDGALLLELPGGVRRRIHAGDVHFGTGVGGS
ncbi:biotin--[acetyl-CoA-carboxylase] ligase [Arenibaculum pallidiluteum]|uniref:biotin--[acetyl-CoA-carboxylase] ligase n=1 Tax=Arenibaculum pallidiluteum TaxID=2812559 RepID=UPI001F271F90|nr:biotin--[acetyl-CoA-carboxylase] ligase [Arenibaculum pallidiluteum]